MDDIFQFIAFLIAALITFLIFSEMDLKENENFCYNFKSFEGLTYQAKYSDCWSTKSGFRCQIDNKIFYTQEFEKVVCDNLKDDI